MRHRSIGGLLALLLALAPAALSAQSVLDRSPNIHGVWGLDSGRGAFVFSHRFELVSGVDELMSIPTFTLAAGLPLGITLGTEFTTFSEVIPDRSTGNEAQLWLKRGIDLPGPFDAAVLAGYNTAASSADGAVDARFSGGRLQLFGEGRVFSSLFGSGETQFAGAVGAAMRLTEHLSVTADIGRVLTVDDVPAAWSAALAAEIPGSPHTFSLQITNTGAATLQGASREKTVGSGDIRYGFTFTVPFGGLDRWARIFRPVAPTRPSTPGAIVARIRQYDYEEREITIERGGTVEWINVDPVVHTVTADDGSWDSGSMADGQRWSRTFREPGRYSYYCAPHPEMRGVVVVR